LLLSVIFKLAVRFPAAVGVNVTLTVQLPFAANELAHVLVSAKSPGLAPVKAIPLIAKAAFPVLLRVKDWVALVVPRFWLAKVRLEVVMPATGPLPVPLKFMVCGLPAALSVMLTTAVRLPIPAGVKVTLMVQELFAATALPQVLLTA
jgi:hypothetical protein